MTNAISLFEPPAGAVPTKPAPAPGEKKRDYEDRVFEVRLLWLREYAKRRIAWQRLFRDKHGRDVDATFYTVICGGGCYCTDAQRQFVEMHEEQAEQYRAVMYYGHSYEGKETWDLPDAFEPPIGDEITMSVPKFGFNVYYQEPSEE